ncbi:hypothetical protein V6N11_017898 [Hibiscus sabdariffa]|uniref:Uncharacterized protein n=2 Tax=Hibiscus sabdariffa TaxID=183260 RepID=A0ABR2T6F8_9ROSI
MVSLPVRWELGPPAFGSNASLLEICARLRPTLLERRVDCFSSPGEPTEVVAWLIPQDSEWWREADRVSDGL